VKRRDFITLLGGAAAVWPLAARAQQPVPMIGFLRSTSSAPFAGLVASFRKGLNEAGLVEGRNVTVDYRWADNQPARLPALVAELIGRKVAVIVGNVEAAHAAKAATATIPIVFVVGSDPVAGGLVANLNRPGGNLTGVSFFDTPLAAKRLSLLNELLPQAAVIAVLLDANFAEQADAEARELSAAAKAIGRQMTIVKIGSEGEFDSAFATIVQSGARGLLVGSGPFFNTQRRRIVALATRHAIPAIYVIREFVEAGGLMSYGASQEDAYRRAGIYVSRVLKGEKPGDLPVELPTKFDLTINIATAKALGIEVPPTLLARADEVIE